MYRNLILASLNPYSVLARTVTITYPILPYKNEVNVCTCNKFSFIITISSYAFPPEDNSMLTTENFILEFDFTEHTLFKFKIILG